MKRKRFDFIDLTVILIWVFIIFKLVDYYFVQIDGILQKLELTFDTPVDDVIASVNDYIKQKEN